VPVVLTIMGGALLLIYSSAEADDAKP